MPDDATNAAIINTAGQVISSSTSAMAQNKLNKKTMKYNDEWAYRQREWALADWNMQNEYNSPANQRKRMIEAGINPALLYGKGAGDLTSGPVRAGGSPSWNPKAPEYRVDAGSSIMSYLGVQRQTAEIEQMQIQNDLLREKLETQKGLTRLTWDRAKFTQNQNEKIEMWINAAKAYQDPANAGMTQGPAGTYYGDKMFMELRQQDQNFMNSINEQERRDMYAANSTTAVLLKAQDIAIRQAKTDAEIQQIRENVKLAQQSGILNDFQINGERFLKNLGAGAQIIRSIISGK